MLWMAKGDLQQARSCAEEAVVLADSTTSDSHITDDRGRAYRLLSLVAFQEEDIVTGKRLPESE